MPPMPKPKNSSVASLTVTSEGKPVLAPLQNSSKLLVSQVVFIVEGNTSDAQDALGKSVAVGTCEANAPIVYLEGRYAGGCGKSGTPLENTTL